MSREPLDYKIANSGFPILTICGEKCRVYQDEDGVWIAECLSIPGCVSQGSSRPEAQDNLFCAINECRKVREETHANL